MSSGPQQTRFYELAGDAAQARLGDLAARLRRGGARTRLLASRDQEGLYLLVADADRLPDRPRPTAAGCGPSRAWTDDGRHRLPRPPPEHRTCRRRPLRRAGRPGRRPGGVLPPRRPGLQQLLVPRPGGRRAGGLPAALRRPAGRGPQLQRLPVRPRSARRRRPGRARRARDRQGHPAGARLRRAGGGAGRSPHACSASSVW